MRAVEERTYGLVWRVVTRLLRVPDHPPENPAGAQVIRVTKPAPAYLAYQRCFFWFFVLVFDGVILVAALATLVTEPWVGVLLLGPLVLLALVPSVIGWIAIRLKYDTCYYVITDRSIRIRHGIFLIVEMTFTYANVQNLKIEQGPLERYFGISRVIIETAGGGGGGGKEGTLVPLHTGVLIGLDDAEAVRDLIQARLRQVRDSGLGDREDGRTVTALPLEGLREIRNAARRLSAAAEARRTA